MTSETPSAGKPATDTRPAAPCADGQPHDTLSAATCADGPSPNGAAATRRPATGSTAKYALVTGASSGIGRAYALRLAARGYGIVVVSDRPEQNEEVAREIRRLGAEALPLHADLTQPDAPERLHARCRRDGIEVEVLVSNAGILHFAQLVRTEPAAIDRIVALHCTAPAKLCRLFADDMRRRGRGYILLMSSMTAWTPFPTMSLYGGVSVTTVFPGAVDTPLYELDPARRRQLRRAGIMRTADEVAAAGLRALFRRRSRCIPGLPTKIAIGLCRLLPACVVTPLLRLRPVARILDER